MSRDKTLDCRTVGNGECRSLDRLVGHLWALFGGGALVTIIAAIAEHGWPACGDVTFGMLVAALTATWRAHQMKANGKDER